ncbi:hypothetical protein FA15DRAFT_420587 [Coprinopsis marcescibilis]|uniref:Nephrocystin 3-like N-terminal domain-containing protein n=1 Tax=Coprinopsis marcescibilis TaxID=230819 RepID=A0A5C3KVK5_COPMA|nr:hypothetical protein FA15DRAFT_420587 [Coprinopsis marcescibilis]
MGLWHSKAGAGAHGTQETDDYMDTSTESPGLASDCEHISPKESTVEAAREVHLLQGAQGITIANSTLRVVGRDSIVHNHHYNVQIEHTKDGEIRPVCLRGLDRTFLVADPKDVEKLANWLADINFRDIQMENSGKRTPGTGFWVLEKGVFKIWVQGSKEGPRILWGTGMPGAGKTIIASLVVEHLERIAKDNPDVCVVFAFCRYTEPIPVRDILAALLRQLLEDYPSVFPFIKALYDRHHLKKIRPLQHELLNVLQQITTSGLFRSTFFVLDGLDEASAAIQFDLIQVLASISAHFFLTSRPLEQWRDQAPDAEFFTIEAPSSDISLLVEQKISRIPALRKLLENNETLKTEVVAKVLHNSSGMFLVASLYLDMLQSCFSVRDLRRSLEHLPKGIDGMYDSTMEQIASQSGADMALLALTWVTFAERPILLDELPYAVAIDPETCKFDPERLVDSSVLVSLCRGLITVEKDPWGARLRLITQHTTI